jgi:hypothetical protein
MESPRRKIARLNTYAKSVEKQIANNNAAAQRRREQEAQKRAQNMNAMKKAREEIGSLVRNAYLKNQLLANSLVKYGGLTPKNAISASIAFASPPFAKVAKIEQERLKNKLNMYKQQYGAWYRSLPNNKRTNIARELVGDNRRHVSKFEENPLVYVTRALNTSKPLIRNDKKYSGTLGAFWNLSTPASNTILRRYGLPFSMVNARKNLVAYRHRSDPNFIRRSAEANYPRYGVPWQASMLHALKRVESPPKGLKGYAGKRIRREFKRRMSFRN